MMPALSSDPCPGTATSNDQAIGIQFVKCLADRYPGNAERSSKITFGWKGLGNTGTNGLAKDFGKLKVEVA